MKVVYQLPEWNTNLCIIITKLSSVRESLGSLHCGSFAFWNSVLHQRYTRHPYEGKRAAALLSGVGL